MWWVVSYESVFQFGRAENFGGDLSRWDVSKVTTMNGMFRRAAKFDSDISRWNTGSVVDMTNMFLNCASFNQDISSWNVSSVTSFAGMVSGHDPNPLHHPSTDLVST
jgi:surface protein